ncbi:MAG TPA: hypothetical protein VFO36_03390 [Nitrospiraceae bacterium]|nr:hypothetical protein [Nitrospiraceae bacterium]
MATLDLSWREDAAALHGPAFARFQTELAKYNGRQLEPRFPDENWRQEIDDYAQVIRAEGEYLEAVRSENARCWRTSQAKSMASLIGSRTSNKRVRVRAIRSFRGLPRVPREKTCCGS